MTRLRKKHDDVVARPHLDQASQARGRAADLPVFEVVEVTGTEPTSMEEDVEGTTMAQASVRYIDESVIEHFGVGGQVRPLVYHIQLSNSVVI